MKNIKPLRKSIQSPKIPLGFRRSPTFLTIPSNCKTQGSNKHNNHSQLLAVKYSWAEWEIKLEIDMPNRKEWGLKPEESIPWTWALIAHMTCIGNAQNCYGVVDSIYHRVVSCIQYCIGKQFPFNGRRADKTKTGPASTSENFIANETKSVLFWFSAHARLKEYGKANRSSSKANVLALFLFSFTNCRRASCFSAFYVGNLGKFGKAVVWVW